MNDSENESNKPQSYKLEEVKEKTTIKEWFSDLFKGFWYGLTDLFLMSWGNIVLLIFLLFVPLAYAVVCALGYWDPVPNLGKVEMPIFDADRTFIKVEDKNTASAYHMGALEEIEDQDGNIVEVTDDVAEQISSQKYDFKNVKDYILNNGITVNKDDAIITPMNTWDTLKNSGLLKKDSPKKADEDSKFEMNVYPNEELHFRNIKYINDAKDDNDTWKSGKYQAQIKINHGYGKALLGLQGITYDQNFQTELGSGKIDAKLAMPLIEKNQNDKLPNIDVFQTFQRNFVSSYILSQTSQFASVVVDKMSPITNAVEDNYSSNQTFGTKGQDILDYLAPVKDNPKLKSIYETINKDDYYLVLSKDEFDKVLGTNALPDNNGFNAKTLLGENGTLATWLNKVEMFANNNGFKAVNADKGNYLEFISKVINGKPDDFIKGIDGLLNNPQSLMNQGKIEGNDAAQALIRNVLTTLYGPTKEQQFEPMIGNFITNHPFNASVKGQQVTHPFIPLNDKVSFFTILSDITAKNEKTFFPFLKTFTDLGMPITVNQLGTAYGSLKALSATHGVDPSKLTKVETARGASMGIFGIGLGQMFILLGTFIGYSMLREILKRNKQYAKLTPRNWYLSKMLDYALIGFVQTTITAWIMYAAGWNKYISATAMTYEWLWLLMGTFVLMAVICGLQFAMDASLGSVLGIFYLAFNITCSGASYPGWMQSKFYWGISWLMPFTYLLEGSNQIIYGINNGGGGHYTAMRLLELWGYSSCFFAFFFLIGLWGCGKQYKVSCYGSSNGAAVYAGLKRLDRIPEMVAFRHPYKDKKGRVKFEYNWNALVGPFDPELYKSTKHTIKKHMMFKWYYKLREKRKIEEREIYGER